MLAVWNLHSRNHCSVFLSIDIPRGIRSYTHLMAFMMSYHLLLIDQASFSIKLRWVSRCGAKKAMQAAPRMLLACFQSLHVRRATICPFLQRLKECERCLGTHSEKIAAEEGDCFPQTTASKIQLPYSPNRPQNVHTVDLLKTANR